MDRLFDGGVILMVGAYPEWGVRLRDARTPVRLLEDSFGFDFYVTDDTVQ